MYRVECRVFSWDTVDSFSCTSLTQSPYHFELIVECIAYSVNLVAAPHAGDMKEQYIWRKKETERKIDTLVHVL